MRSEDMWFTSGAFCGHLEAIVGEAEIPVPVTKRKLFVYTPMCRANELDALMQDDWKG